MTLRAALLRHLATAALCGALLPTSAALAQTADPAVMARMHAEIDADGARLIEVFKDLHRNPELAFMEVRTAGIVADELAALGYEVKTGIAETGVVGILRNGDGPTIMFRGDMDANAVKEATGVDYASTARAKLPGKGTEVPVAHMCGHDAHTTWLLGLAKAMASNKDAWSGTLVLVSQPAEETITGARAMVDDGLYTTHGVPVPDALLATHTAPFPVGMVAAGGGLRNAGTEQIDVTFYGIGGHGSTPQQTKDPIVMAAAAIMQYQMIVSRLVDPQETAVLSVGAIEAGLDNNVIPESAELKLNLRFFSPSVRDQMIAAIRSINEGIARTYGMSEDKMPKMVMKGASTPLYNDAALVDRINVPLKALLGEQAVITTLPPVTGSEDVHLLMGGHEMALGVVLVGIADPAAFMQAQKEGKVVPFVGHNPNYLVDLKSIPLGTKIVTTMVMEMMAKQ